MASLAVPEDNTDLADFCNDCQKVVEREDREQHPEHDVKKYSKVTLLTSAVSQVTQHFSNIKKLNKEEGEKLVEMFSELSLEDITDGFLDDSIRSETEVKPDGFIKVATWNLQNFNSEQIPNDTKISLICDTILTEDFDVIALQEVGEYKKVGIKSSDSAIQRLHQKLNEEAKKKRIEENKKTGNEKLHEVSVEEQQWQMYITESHIGKLYQGNGYGVFLWKTASGIQTQSPFVTLEDKTLKDETSKKKTFKYTRKPVAGHFKIGDWEFCLINLHLKERGSNSEGKKKNNEEVMKLSTLVINPLVVDKECILLGDFNTYVSINDDFDQHFQKYINLLGRNEFTNTNNDSSYDGIIVHKRYVKHKRYDSHGVSNIQTTPTFSADKVSDHRPVWVKFKYWHASNDDDIENISALDNKSELEEESSGPELLTPKIEEESNLEDKQKLDDTTEVAKREKK